MATKYLYGIKYAIPYDLDTMEPKGIFEVIGSVEVSREIEQMLLTGGHKDGPYAVEAGEPTNGLTATLKEYPNFSYSLFENADITTNAAANAGTIGTFANTKGVSVFDAATGIASVSITVGKENELPSGNIVIKAVGADSADIYLLGDVIKGRVPIIDELPKLASGVTIIGTAGTVELAGYGLTLNGGSGAVALVEGDIAFVEVQPPSEYITKIQVGKSAGVNYFGLLLVYPRNSEKEQAIVRFPKVAAVGMSFNGNTREFSEFEQAMTPLLSDTEDILYELVRTKSV